MGQRLKRPDTVRVLSFNFSKALDKAPHDSPLVKLDNLSINRQLLVSIAIAQGSIPGHFVFMNDLSGIFDSL